MSAKRPRPAIPVLVHVDNPAEVGSVVVDTSTIDGKMDTVINNQERIYNKIPTSSGGGSVDLTTVNEKITDLAESIGPPTSVTSDNNIFGTVKTIKSAIGDYYGTDSLSGVTVKARLYNIQSSLGDATESENAGKYNVKSLLYNIRTTVGNALTTASPANLTLRGLCMNVRNSIGDSTVDPTSTGTTVRDLLTAIKQNTASGGSGGSADLTTVNEKTTQLAAAIGTADSVSSSYDLLGRIKNLVSAVGDANIAPALNGTTTRSYLYNIRAAIGSGSDTPTLTGTSVRDLLTQIKENTASGGGGGGADLTTVNEKTTALATAIGSADDSSSTVSVIGLLKSITDKY